MMSKPFYFSFTILAGILFILFTYLSLLDISIFQKGHIIKGKIVSLSNICTKNNVVEVDYNGLTYSFLIGYPDCKNGKYIVGDSIQLRAIIGERRTQLPNDDPRIIAIITIVVLGSIFLYFLFNYKYLTAPQSKE